MERIKALEEALKAAVKLRRSMTTLGNWSEWYNVRVIEVQRFDKIIQDLKDEQTTGDKEHSSR